MTQINDVPFRCEDIPLIRLRKIKSRKIDDKAFARIRKSIIEIGLLEPLLVRPCEEEGYFDILDGDWRYDILMELGLETAPCYVRDELDIYTANYQVNHLSPVEESRMITKATEVVDEKLIAEVFGLKKLAHRLSETLIKRLHPTVVNAFNNGIISRACAVELAEVLPDRQLEIFAMMQNTKNFGPQFVKKQILLTPVKKQQSKRPKTPWMENKERTKSLGTNLTEMQGELNHLAKLYREYTAALMLTVVHSRAIIGNKVLGAYLKEKMPEVLEEIKSIIESELIEKKGGV